MIIIELEKLSIKVLKEEVLKLLRCQFVVECCVTLPRVPLP